MGYDGYWIRFLKHAWTGEVSDSADLVLKLYRTPSPGGRFFVVSTFSFSPLSPLAFSS
jgi:hypothetical protein